VTAGGERDVEGIVRAVLSDILALPPERVARFDVDTRLFGALPELDSMAVANLLAELEDRLDIRIEDEEVDGDLFATFGALLRFAEVKAAR
jgi:acyl carrier protein